MKTAKELLQKMERTLQEIKNHGNSPSNEIQEQVIQMLKETKIAAAREGDTETEEKAHPFVLKLIANRE